MTDAARLGQYALGLEGLALLRQWLTGDPSTIAGRLDAIRQLVARLDEPALAASVAEGELLADQGYARWAATYDSPNPAVAQEERAVRPLMAAVSAGRALDAACGTGRHARYLAARGHTVIGVDASPEMLAAARANVPHASFLLGTLEGLPLGDQAVDLAVCALALTHCADLVPAVRELARVVRPGGTIILSDIHPFAVLLGNHAVLQDAAGRRAFVRNYVYLPSAYLAAFTAAGLQVIACLEPLNTEAELPPLAPEFQAAAALLGLPGTLVWALRRS